MQEGKKEKKSSCSPCFTGKCFLSRWGHVKWSWKDLFKLLFTLSLFCLCVCSSLMWTMSASPAWLPSIIYCTCASMQPKHLPWVQTSLSQAPPGKAWCCTAWYSMMLYNIRCMSSFNMKYLYKMNIYLYTCAIDGKSIWDIDHLCGM